ncbi:MAG TPA: sialate O-acetylesterase [Terracidiphilus sp.]|nr:sialate O-acetylesterase [Terracidiphilus sp.]
MIFPAQAPLPSRCLIRRSLLSLLILLVAQFAAFGQSATANPATTATVLISLASPLDYQVFQRSTRLKGSVEVRGKADVAADSAQARLTGTSLAGPLTGGWVRLHFSKATGEFRGSLATIPGGFYELDVRLLRAHAQVAATNVAHVGVGEVFVIAGQSNSTNYGEVRQTTQTGMVAAFSGNAWQIADDPQPGVQDNSSKGSFIPAFGDALYREYHVPIGIAAVGHGSTSVRQWLPAGTPIAVMPTMTKFIMRNEDGKLTCDGTLFNGMMQRIHRLGRHGFRALLWHQGESDAHQKPGHQIDGATYRQMMIKLIRDSRRQAGWNFPWIVAEATYHSPADASDPDIEQAQQSLWRSGIALEGPNTDALGSEYRQNHGTGVHFSGAGLKAHGELWAQAVEHYLDTVLR